MSQLQLYDLRQRQSLPLEQKVILSQKKIREWHEHWDGDIYVAFSGGKDSTVLLHMVRQLYPSTPGVFSDTGLEFPELKEFIKTFENIITVRPKKSFKQVIETCGYPIVSKKVARAINDLQNPTPKNIASRNLYLTGLNGKGEPCPSRKLAKKWFKLIEAPFKVSSKCCDIMKKTPLKKYTKESGQKPIVGIMASESSMREREYLKSGCNAFNSKNPISTPMSFWTEQDVLEYLVKFNLPYASVYGEIKQDESGHYSTTGENRTGCIWCGFGCHLEQGENRFQRMKRTHPKLWEYCMKDLKLKEVLEFIDVPFE